MFTFYRQRALERANAAFSWWKLINVIGCQASCLPESHKSVRLFQYKIDTHQLKLKLLRNFSDKIKLDIDKIIACERKQLIQ